MYRIYQLKNTRKVYSGFNVSQPANITVHILPAPAATVVDGYEPCIPPGNLDTWSLAV